MGKGPGWYCQFIGLNPSTADEKRNDPTIRRCIDYCVRWGFREFCMTNLFGYRATDPRMMKAQLEPVGPDNVEWIVECAKTAGLVVAAWGCDGKFNDQDEIVLTALHHAGVEVHALKVTQGGHPAHPLYLAATRIPIVFKSLELPL